MSRTVIKVENVSKLYKLGEVGTASFKSDLSRSFGKLLGKRDTTMDHAEENDRTVASRSNVSWALQDISFELQQGEVLGVIGKNGAGKSTLLKILSRTTAPTRGTIKLKGRMASLLEVGTGFHPDLTGRENVFLNGAILGMTKRQIKAKFDEIVEFSGVERYIDTPVKRYSSGMYVRLAFAVAAHLESEILVMDEVLAVGDAAFQKKCLGKMNDASKDGRTVLFVSHNISAIKSLCTKTLLLKNGKAVNFDVTPRVVDDYFRMDSTLSGELVWENKAPAIEGKIKMHSVKSMKASSQVSDTFDVKEAVNLECVYEVLEAEYCYSVHYYLKTDDGLCAFVAMDGNFNPYQGEAQPAGIYKASCTIPANLLNEGSYYVEVVICTLPTSVYSLAIPDALCINVVDDMQPGGSRGPWQREWPSAIIRPDLDWKINKLS